jgi:hypothetical protein
LPNSGNTDWDGETLIPSPDERYLAIVGRHLWIFDITSRGLVDFGQIQIHSSEQWDYIKSSWDPWFRDSSLVTFSTGRAIYVASPDGAIRERIAENVPASLPVPSPDGQSIAYVTFTPRPIKMRADLSFFGDATVWVIRRGQEKSVRVTGHTDDTTLGLRWLNSETVIFDRISDEPFYRHARIWTAPVPLH